jgi:hypothetical protein
MLRLDLRSVLDVVVGVSVVLSFRCGVVSSVHNRFRVRLLAPSAQIINIV